MTKLMLTAAVLSLGVLTLGATGGAIGHAHAQGAGVTVPPANLIVARQAGMDLQDGLLAAMKAAIDSKGDVKSFKDSADALTAWGHAIPGLFVPGTESGNNTKAKPDVFSDQAGFGKAAEALSSAATTLSVAADANDKAAFATAFLQVGRSCGGCHRNYRAR